MCFHLTWRGSLHIHTTRGSGLSTGLFPLAVVLRVFHFLTCVAQIAQDAHAVLDRLVVDVILAYGGLHNVQDGLDKTLAFS